MTMSHPKVCETTDSQQGTDSVARSGSCRITLHNAHSQRW
jgi:hypothetical protein